MSDFDPYYQWLGIPIQEQPASHYRLLGIPEFDGNVDIIKAAAERQTIYLRTLQAGEHAVLVAELLNEVSQARVTLLNADQKAEYDEELRKQQTPEPVPEPAAAPIPAIPTPAPLQNIPSPTPFGDREPVVQNRPHALAAEWSTFQPTKKPRGKGQKEIWKRPAVIGISSVGVIGVFVLVISLMSSGDADPVASNSSDQISAEMAVETAAVEKAAAVTAALDKGDWKTVLSLYPNNSEGLRMKAVADKAATDKAVADKAAMEKAAMEKAAMEKAAMEKAAMEKAAMEKAAMEKAAMEKAAMEKAAMEKAAMEKAAMEKAAMEKAAMEKAAMEKAAMEKAAILAGDPITNTFGMTLNKIPAGTFMMGSPEGETGRGKNEQQHKITITKAFYMQTTEVTQGQWKEVMGTEPWKGKPYVKEGPNYAATWVSWNDAVAYCKKLSEQERKTYRLPTEAEWEYACRAGTETAWSFGNDEKDLGDYAWYRENAWDIDEKYAHQVELKKPNAFGLYDMYGNVYEWCHDYFEEDYYKQSPAKDPTGPTSGSSRVLRGGSWYYFTRFTRSASRNRSDARRNSYNGFRLVRELD
jgi:sulfatase modifying factor 1